MGRRRYRKSQNRCEAARPFFVSARLFLQSKHYAKLMAVMMPREKWTDERLDDLSKKVDEGFANVAGEIKRLDGDINRLDGEITRLDGNITRLDGNIKRLDNDIGRLDGNFNELRREINARFESIDLRLDSLNRNLQATMVAVIVALIGSNAF
jgi:peptidoglycan hydrolase CwlO-like protein